MGRKSVFHGIGMNSGRAAARRETSMPRQAFKMTIHRRGRRAG
jgi:hypothetical protein